MTSPGLASTLRLAQKEMQRARAVMLGNKISNFLWEINLFGQLLTVGHVTDNNPRALRRA